MAMSEVATVEEAAGQVQAPARLIEVMAPEFGKLLPAVIGEAKFARWALTVLRKGLGDPKQAEAWGRVLDPRNEAGRLSVISAFMDCASLGLEPGREYHLVPFGSTVTGITDYKGEIRLITNARPCSVIAMLVREADDFHLTGANIPPVHDAEWFADRGRITGGYSYVSYGSGEYSLVVRMSEADFGKHRDKAKTKQVWDEWPEPMRLKTLVHQVRKMVPWSAEWRPGRDDDR
jgi:recombination protein RecT